MTLTQQWQYLNLTVLGTVFTYYFLRKVRSRKIISSRLYIHLKGTCSLGSRVLTPVNKLNNININVNYSKIPESSADRTKCPREPYAARVFETPGVN